MKRLILLLVSSFLFLPNGCTKLISLPSAPAPTSTIFWNSAYVTRSACYTGGVPYCGSFDAGVTLSVNGLPESTAAVTLTGPSGSVPLTYVGPVTAFGTVYAFYQYTHMDGPMIIPPPFIFAYVPGQNYILTTFTSAGTASVTAVAPGGFGGGASSAGITVSWSFEGNADQVLVVAPGPVTTFVTTGDANSPVFSPSSAYTSLWASRTFSCRQIANNISGAAPGSVFTISQIDSSVLW